MLPSMFVDKVKIHAKAGNGGNGCVSFRREKYVDHGGPDGGDGGKGGHIVLVADKNVDNLVDLYYAPHVVARNGGYGRGKGCTGRSAKDVLVRVPIGTQAFRLTRPTRQPAPTRYHPAAATEEFSADAEVGTPFGMKRRPATETCGSDIPVATGLSAVAPAKTDRGGDAAPTEITAERELIADLVEDGQRFVLAKGGRGGHGNTHFKSSTHRAPREFEYGEPGEELNVELELKTLADVGLVGFPNAGKSTLISKITKAHPKIAPYPFTTLTPNVGIVIYDEDFTRIRVADIPGLIEGAHVGKGLGHDFLRHIERCGLLLVLLDMAGVDGRKPWEDYKQLLQELELYKSGILDKPRLVVANKMDLPEARRNLTAFKRKVGRASRSSKSQRTGRTPIPSEKILEISAMDGTGLEELKLALRKALA
jgi:GTPase